MEVKELIDTFNTTWKGKDVYFCNLIRNTLNFVPEGVALCCSSTNGDNPIACDISIENGLEFNELNYVKAIIKVFENIQKGKNCVGCKRLVKIPFEEWTQNQIKVENINWNHFKGCNSRCIYCNETNSLKKYYEPLGFMEDLCKSEFIADSVSVSFGGGEPTLLKNLEDYIEFAQKVNWTQLLNTSGLLNKNIVKEFLARDKNFWVQISVDSGTPETYLKVKGQSGYDVVWSTIRDYCSISRNILVKYVLFSYNSDKKEIDAFIGQCSKNGVNNICISGEMISSLNSEHTLPWNFGTQEIDAAAYMLGKIVNTDFAAFFPRSIFSKENVELILNVFISDYLIPWIQTRAICIWGMGSYGKLLYDILIQHHIEVECFGDNDKAKQGRTYRQTTCLSLDQIKKKIKQKDFCIFLSISRYESAYLQLKKELPDVDIRVLVIL